MGFNGIEFSQEVFYINALLSIALGILSCFWGYRSFKVILGILGAVVGALLAGNIAFRISGGNTIIAIIASLVGSMIGVSLMVSLYFAGIFILGAGLGGLLGIVIAAAVGSEPSLIISLILAIIGGIAAIIVQKLMIILATSFCGSWCVVIGILYFVKQDVFRLFFWQPESLPHMGTGFYVMLICWLFLGIVGFTVQSRITGKTIERNKGK